MTAPRKLDPVEPLLTREMFATDEDFFDALIKMARTGRVSPVEPAPPYPEPGPIAHKALAQLALAPPDPKSARPTPMPPRRRSTRGPKEDGPQGVEAAHVPKNAKGRVASAAPEIPITTTPELLSHRRQP